MPPCYCIAHGCRGRDVSEAMRKQHRSDNAPHLTNTKFQQAGRAAIQAYEKTVGEYHLNHSITFRGTTSVSPSPNCSSPVRPGSASPFDMSSLGKALEGISSNPQPTTPPALSSASKVTGSSISGPSTPLCPSTRASSSKAPATYSNRVQKTLNELTGLESRVKRILDSLSTIREGGSTDPECLSPLYDQAGEISSEIQAISITVHSVVQFRLQVQETLAAVVADLDTLQGTLATKSPVPPDDQAYDTSKLSHFMRRVHPTHIPCRSPF